MFCEFFRCKRNSFPTAKCGCLPIHWFIYNRTNDDFFESLSKNADWKEEQVIINNRIHKQPRLTAWYGDEGVSYTYSGLTLHSSRWQGHLLAIKTKIEGKIKPISEIRFNSVLLNFYRDGQDHMGWHSDAESSLGKNPIIASYSLGGSRRFVMKHKKTKKKFEITLNHGDLLLMAGQTQRHWRHALPKTRKLTQPRINLTFRRVYWFLFFLGSIQGMFSRPVVFWGLARSITWAVRVRLSNSKP